MPRPRAGRAPDPDQSRDAHHLRAPPRTPARAAGRDDAWRCPRASGPFPRSGLFSWPGKLRMGLDLLAAARRRRGRRVDRVLPAAPFRHGGGGTARRAPDGRHPRGRSGAGSRSARPFRASSLSKRNMAASSAGWAAAARDAPAATGSAFYSLGRRARRARGRARREPARRARRRTSAAVTRLERREGGTLLTLADGTTVAAQAVVIAVPAPAAAPLLAPLSPAAGRRWRRSPSPRRPRSRFGYRRADVGHRLTATASSPRRGSACGARPARSSRRSSPAARPEGHVLLRAFVGGTRDPGVRRPSGP